MPRTLPALLSVAVLLILTAACGGDSPLAIPTPSSALGTAPTATGGATGGTSGGSAVATPTTPVSTPAGREHIVASGETLSEIALQFDVTVDAIVELNNITDPNQILVGQVLKIPDGS